MFFLPAFLFYAFTGTMFMFNQRSMGALVEEKMTMAWPADKTSQIILAEEYLKNNGYKTKRPPDIIISTPVGLRWGHSGSFSIAMTYNEADGQVAIKVYNPTLYSRLMAWHANRAGGDFFQIFAIIFSVGWLLSHLNLLTKHRHLPKKQRWLCFGAGSLITAAICLISL